MLMSEMRSVGNKGCLRHTLAAATLGRVHTYLIPQVIATLRWPGFCRRAHTLQRRPRDPQSLCETSGQMTECPSGTCMRSPVARETGLGRPRAPT